ncbi:unnamed protein product [Chrysoparadoxa australica]
MKRPGSGSGSGSGQAPRDSTDTSLLGRGSSAALRSLFRERQATVKSFLKESDCETVYTSFQGVSIAVEEEEKQSGSAGLQDEQEQCEDSSSGPSSPRGLERLVSVAAIDTGGSSPAAAQMQQEPEAVQRSDSISSAHSGDEFNSVGGDSSYCGEAASDFGVGDGIRPDEQPVPVRERSFLYLNAPDENQILSVSMRRPSLLTEGAVASLSGFCSPRQLSPLALPLPSPVAESSSAAFGLSSDSSKSPCPSPRELSPLRAIDLTHGVAGDVKGSVTESASVSPMASSESHAGVLQGALEAASGYHSWGGKSQHPSSSHGSVFGLASESKSNAHRGAGAEVVAAAAPAPAVVPVVVAVPLGLAEPAPHEAELDGEEAPPLGVCKLQLGPNADKGLGPERFLRAHSLLWAGYFVAADEELGCCARASPAEEGQCLWVAAVRAEGCFLNCLLSLSVPALQAGFAAAKDFKGLLDKTLGKGHRTAAKQAKREVSKGLGGLSAAACTSGRRCGSRPSVAAQALLLELENCFMRGALHLCGEAVMKAVNALHKGLKHGQWLLRAVEGVRHGSSTTQSAQLGAAGGAGVNPGSKKAGAAPGPSGLPELYAGGCWHGYLHHARFLAGMMHACISLLPQPVSMVLGKYLGYKPQLRAGVDLLVSSCRESGLRQQFSGAALGLIQLREMRLGTGASSAFHAAASMTASQALELGQAEEGGSRRLKAELSLIEDVLEAFYASSHQAPLLSIVRAKVYHASGCPERGLQLCEEAQAHLERGGLTTLPPLPTLKLPLQQPYVLWVHLAMSQFFSQQWSDCASRFAAVAALTEASDCRDGARTATLCRVYIAACSCAVDHAGKVMAELAEATNALERRGKGQPHYPLLWKRLLKYVSRGRLGCHLWLAEFLYMHCAGIANCMPTVWHTRMLKLIRSLPIAQASACWTAEARDDASTADAVLEYHFLEGMILYKLNQAGPALECFRRAHSMGTASTSPFLPHAFFLSALLGYRLQPYKSTLKESHMLCVSALRLRAEPNFDCTKNISRLKLNLEKFM